MEVRGIGRSTLRRKTKQLPSRCVYPNACARPTNTDMTETQPDARPRPSPRRWRGRTDAKSGRPEGCTSSGESCACSRTTLWSPTIRAVVIAHNPDPEQTSTRTTRPPGDVNCCYGRRSWLGFLRKIVPDTSIERLSVPLHRARSSAGTVAPSPCWPRIAAVESACGPLPRGQRPRSLLRRS